MAKAKATQRGRGATDGGAGDGADGDLAIARFIEEARALPKTSVQVVGIDARLALHNARVGAASVLRQRARLKGELPKADAAVLATVVPLAEAYDACSRRVDRSAKKKIAPRYARASELRRIVLANARSLAEAGVLDAAKVRKLEAGRGKLDAARDCVDLAALYRDQATAVRGKTPITSTQLDEMESLGNQLVAMLSPTGAKKTVAPDVVSALELRNRIGTLLLARWELLWRAGAWLYGKGIDAAVPPLLSRRQTVKRSPAPAPTPPV